LGRIAFGADAITQDILSRSWISEEGGFYGHIKLVRDGFGKIVIFEFECVSAPIGPLRLVRTL
jgi:hypothetical protein